MKPNMDLYTHVVGSPLGDLTLAVFKTGAVYAVRFGRVNDWALEITVETNKYACGELALELSEYFAGKRREFSLTLAPTGTEFQREIWHALRKVRFGNILSYSELATQAGHPGAARAAATAVAMNPIPILIPCHRVIMQSGKAGLYATHFVTSENGKRMKRILLELENAPINWARADN